MKFLGNAGSRSEETTTRRLVTTENAWDLHDGRLLIGLLLFNGIGAVGGGVAILIHRIGLPLSLLDGTPFKTYTIPGWILLVVVGGSSVVASVMVWRRMRHAPEAAITAGAILLGWIVTEFVMIPEAWIPQLLYLVLSLAILWLGGQPYRRNRGIQLYT